MEHYEAIALTSPTSPEVEFLPLVHSFLENRAWDTHSKLLPLPHQHPFPKSDTPSEAGGLMSVTAPRADSFAEGVVHA